MADKTVIHREAIMWDTFGELKSSDRVWGEVRSAQAQRTEEEFEKEKEGQKKTKP